MPSSHIKGQVHFVLCTEYCGAASPVWLRVAEALQQSSRKLPRGSANQRASSDKRIAACSSVNRPTTTAAARCRSSQVTRLGTASRHASPRHRQAAFMFTLA
ncbi:hypothetical protein CISG_04993 [Coccidioides immitis RMSCC 3703]|uniref:Uncharacterized protein n=1 Tax=Coccidioides immitis RMSCC 3703 TaxID=454286 RepID=A0A0J8QU75_COCIT|nr:hypothetical protein CISG_04993 [Coccidioides immitis RMSCC 3703]